VKQAPQTTLAQAVLLQRTIRAMKDDIPLVQNLSTLAAMAPEQLLQVLVSTKINIVDVLGKLTAHMEPAKAAEVWRSFEASSSGGGGAPPAAAPAAVGPSDMQRSHQHQQEPQQRGVGVGAALGGMVVGNGNNAPLRGPGGQPRGLMLGGPLPPSAVLRVGASNGAGVSSAGSNLGKASGRSGPSSAAPATAAAGVEKVGVASQQQSVSASAGAGSGEEGSGGHPLGVVNQEILDQCTKRLKPGTVKHSVFVVLRDEAGSKGMAVAEIYAAMQRRGMASQWSDPRAAKSSIASSCAHDAAFVRIRQGVFALRACLPQSMLDSLTPAAAVPTAGGGASGRSGGSTGTPAKASGASGRGGGGGGGMGLGRRAAAAGVAAAAAAAAGSPASSGASPEDSSDSMSGSFGDGEGDEAEGGGFLSARNRRGSFTGGGSEDNRDGDYADEMEGVEGPGGRAVPQRAPGQPPQQTQTLPKPPGPTAGLPAQNQPLAPGHSNPVHAYLRREAFARNTHKCGICHKTYHPTYSPLVLCDFCPRAHHVYCLDLDWTDLPEHEWACPKCLAAPAQRANKGLQYEQRKMDAQER
jgi:hypothetical protein